MFGVGLLFFPLGTCHSQNLPPIIDPIGTRYVNEGDTLDVNLHATDPDGHVLKMWVVDSPPGAEFSDEGTGHADNGLDLEGLHLPLLCLQLKEAG